MDDKTQKERLEQELKFLKESFEAEVISREEFDKGRDRIERKLNEIEKEAKIKKEIKEEKPKEESREIEKKEEIKAEPKAEEKIKLNVIQEEEHEHVEHVQSTPEKASFQEPKKEAIGQKNGKFFKYAVVFVVLLLAIFFLYSTFKDNKSLKEKIEPIKAAETAPKINVLVVNDRKNCFNCDTQRVIGILESWFGALNAKEIDYNTDEGKIIAEKFYAKLLPLYVLDENITKKQSFGQFKQVFVKKDSSYVLNENTAGSTFYFKRENMPNKLDLFVKPGDDASIKAEKNLQEFLENFKGVKSEKHLFSDNLTKELDIKIFPTFLVNNRVKFSGIHPAETIKVNFCKLNNLKECENILSKYLV